MNKQALLANLERSRAELESTLARIPAEMMAESNAASEWSVKDVLAHLAMWSSRCVTLVYDAEHNQPADGVDAMFDSRHALNADDYESQKDRPLERILSDFRGAHRQLLKRLNDWDQATLFDRSRYAWLRGQSIGDFIQSQVAEHEAEHQQAMARWLPAEGSAGH